MIRDTRPQDGIGMSTMQRIVQGRGMHGWQPYDPNNDNGVDGVIILRKNIEVLRHREDETKSKVKKERADTGELVFVQVKCGSGNGYYKETNKRPAHFGVNVGEDYIEKHKERWSRLPGPIIMVYVDFKSEKAWWTDLRDSESYSLENKNVVLISKKQRFGKHSFGEFRKKFFKDFRIQSISVPLKVGSEVSFLSLKSDDTIIKTAKDYYTVWSNSTAKDRTHPELGEIIISRVGWRHLIKKKRTQLRIINSLLNLKIAKNIILNTPKCYQLRIDKPTHDIHGNSVLVDYLAIRREIDMPHKQNFVVQVVLKRKRIINKLDGSCKSKIWFYSVYEPFS